MSYVNKEFQQKKNKVCQALLKLWLIYGWKKSYLDVA